MNFLKPLYAAVILLVALPSKATYVGGNPMSYVDPTGLARCTYSNRTGILSCQSNDGNRQYATNAFSGKAPNFSPLPVDHYKLQTAQGWPSSFFFLSRGPFMDYMYRISKGKAVRGGFMVHPGSYSEGCITVKSKNSRDMANYQDIQDLITSELSDSTLEVVD